MDLFHSFPSSIPVSYIFWFANNKFLLDISVSFVSVLHIVVFLHDKRLYGRLFVLILYVELGNINVFFLLFGHFLMNTFDETVLKRCIRFSGLQNFMTITL